MGLHLDVHVWCFGMSPCCAPVDVVPLDFNAFWIGLCTVSLFIHSSVAVLLSG